MSFTFTIKKGIASKFSISLINEDESSTKYGTNLLIYELEISFEGKITNIKFGFNYIRPCIPFTCMDDEEKHFSLLKNDNIYNRSINKVVQSIYNLFIKQKEVSEDISYDKQLVNLIEDYLIENDLEIYCFTHVLVKIEKYGLGSDYDKTDIYNVYGLRSIDEINDDIEDCAIKYNTDCNSLLIYKDYVEGNFDLSTIDNLVIVETKYSLYTKKFDKKVTIKKE